MTKEFSFGNYRICSNNVIYLAYSCQEQGQGRSLKTWHKCMNLSLPSWLDGVLLTLWATRDVCPLDGSFVKVIFFFQMIPILLASKPPRRADSVTMATISSREIRWVKVINITTKRKCWVIKITFQFIMKGSHTEFSPKSLWSWSYLIITLNQNRNYYFKIDVET